MRMPRVLQQGERVAIHYPPDFALPERLLSQNAALTFLCNPNSPSGTLVPLQAIEKLACSVSGILVVDEAYVDFAATEGASTLPLVRSLPNLVVLRTFSKSFSLAGMRIGLAFAAEDIIAGLMKVQRIWWASIPVALVGLSLFADGFLAIF